MSSPGSLPLLLFLAYRDNKVRYDIIVKQIVFQLLHAFMILLNFSMQLESFVRLRLYQTE